MNGGEMTKKRPTNVSAFKFVTPPEPFSFWYNLIYENT